jgi:hypothetical protein
MGASKQYFKEERGRNGTVKEYISEASKQYFKEERAKIIKGLDVVQLKLIEFKKQKNSPLVISRNGEIIEIDPNEILEPETPLQNIK